MAKQLIMILSLILTMKFKDATPLSGNIKPKKEKLNLRLGSFAGFDPLLSCQWNCFLPNLRVMVVLNQQFQDYFRRRL